MKVRQALVSLFGALMTSHLAGFKLNSTQRAGSCQRESLTPRPIGFSDNRLRLVTGSRARCVAVAVYAGGVLLALVVGFDAA